MEIFIIRPKSLPAAGYTHLLHNVKSSNKKEKKSAGKKYKIIWIFLSSILDLTWTSNGLYIWFWFNSIDRRDDVLHPESCRGLTAVLYRRQKRSHPSSASNGCKSERKDNMSVFVLWARLLWVRQSQETSVATNRLSRRRKRSARLCWRESVKRLLNLPMYTKNSSSVSSLIDSTTFFSLPLSERSQTDTEKKDGKRYDKADKNEKKEN